MNKLSLTNNAGWSFIYNGERSVEVKDQFGINCGEAPYIYLNDLTPDEMDEIERSEGIEREKLITQFLQNRFKNLSSECVVEGKSSTFHVQCYEWDNKPFVVFEKYGLQGGGRNQFLAFTSGVAKVGFGIILGAGAVASGGTAAPIFAACGGAGLLSSGIGDMLYAVRTSEKDITAKGYATQTAIGFAAGAAGGGAGLAVNAVATQTVNTLVTTVLSSGASTVASTTAGTVTEAVIKKDARVLKRLTPEKLAASVAVGVLTGGVSSLSKGTVEAGGSLLFNSSSTLATKTMMGAAAGAASSSAVKITENFINKYAFLKVMYETKPDDYLIEPGKLYVYTQQNEIVFLSVNTKGQMIITRIREQKQFLAQHERENSFENLLMVLRSKGRRNFSEKQQQFILESASRYNHVPINLLNGVADAAAVGASSGATIGFTKAVVDQRQTTAPIPRRDPEERKKLSHLVKRVKVATNADKQGEEATLQKRKFEGGTFLKRRTFIEVKRTTSNPSKADNPKALPPFLGKRVRVVVKDGGQSDPTVLKRKFEEGALLKRRTFTRGKEIAATDETNKASHLKDRNKRVRSDEKVDSTSKTQEPPTENNNDDKCVLIPVSPEQLKAAQDSVNHANQKFTNLVALSQYSAVDIENKATEIFNDTKNLHYYSSSQAIPYIEKKLSEEFGIPMGTLTDSLKAAYRRNPDDFVPGPIIAALTEKKNNGSAISLAKDALDQATQTLQSLKEPKCMANEPVGIPQATLQTPSSFNILELVTDSENIARNSGNAGNVNVQMRYLTTRIVGTDSGDLFDGVYSVFLDASFKWEAYRGKDKPTQYGFLTSVSDLLINGASTVPVEVKDHPWYASALGYAGEKGIGFQINDAGLQVGTMNTPNLVTVYSTASPQGIEGFQLPQSSSSPLPTHSSAGGNSNSGVGTALPPLPAAVQPVPEAAITKGTESVSAKSPTPSLPVVENPTVLGSGKVLPQQVTLAPEVYAVADGVQSVLKKLDTVPGLEGLGGYAGGAIGKVTTTLSTLERVADPDYQNQPAAQRIGCAVWGTTVELAGQAVAVPFGPFVGGAIAYHLSEQASLAGDDAQQNCHDVINLFK